MGKHKRRSIKKTRPFYVFLIALILLGILGLTVSFSRIMTYFQSHADSGNIILLYPNPEIAKNNLQLKTFPFITVPPPRPTTVPTAPPVASPPAVAPPTGGYCPLDSLKPTNSNCACIDSNAVACPAPVGSGLAAPQCNQGGFPMQLPILSGTWYCVQLGSLGMSDPNPSPPPAGCLAACIGKPVIYLYPPKKTHVDVSVKTNGNIFVSDPLYPDGGWKNVEANPNGDLFYNNKKYSELFYESRVNKKIPMPTTGILIASANLETTLTTVTTQLGLHNTEQRAFLAYWVPKLQQLHEPYIFFSLLSPEVKLFYDQVTISPKPDTSIEFIAYFKPLSHSMAVDPLQLPKTPPSRVGFTEVEWGGTIVQ